MAGSVRRSIGALGGVLLAAVALVASPLPASAQPFTGGTFATIAVGSGITANCPPGTPGAVAGGGATTGPFTVFNAGARCSPTAAAADGLYFVSGVSSPALRFSADCDANNGQTGGGVDVPAGTIVNFGSPGAFTTTDPITPVATPNTVVRYPNGTTATLNQVVVDPGVSVTRNAIVSGGSIVGQVVCGRTAAPYPLAVDTAAAAGPASALPLPGASSSEGGGFAGAALLIGAAVVLVVGAQVAVGRRMRRQGDATG